MLSIFNTFEFYLYLIQQKIYSFLSLETNIIILGLICLISGCLTSLNPCLISMLPISISYILMQNRPNFKKSNFIIGLATSLIFMILLTSLFNKHYISFLNSIPILSSILLICISLSLLNIIHLKLYWLKSIKLSVFNDNSFFQVYFIGFILGLSSAPCSAPILLTLLFWLSSTQSLILALIYLCFYLFGFIMPIIILVNITVHYSQMKIISDFWEYLIPINGSFLLGFSIFLFLEKILV